MITETGVEEPAKKFPRVGASSKGAFARVYQARLVIRRPRRLRCRGEPGSRHPLNARTCLLPGRPERFGIARFGGRRGMTGAELHSAAAVCGFGALFAQ